jgi:hypothetical protein
MILDVLERLVLLSILPKEGDFTTLKIVRKLREDLSFTEEEHAVLKFEDVENGGGVKWNYTAEDSKEIQIGEKASDVISKVLEKLSSDKKLGEHHLSLYEKFVDK